MSHSMNPHPPPPVPPEQMNTSSFLILQQQAALEAAQAQGSLAANPEHVVVSQNGSSSTPMSLMPASMSHHPPVIHHGPPFIPPPKAPEQSALLSPTLVDHCNVIGGFHDGFMLNDVINDQEEDYVDDVGELNSLEGCAFQSRMNPGEMSPEEVKAFPDLVDQANVVPVYLYVRNAILRLWFAKPRKQLILEEVYRGLDPPYNQDHQFISRVYHYLERYGYINYGIFKIETDLQLTKRPKIIVIGAGIAGLIAARQLQYFGFDVFVLESRNRIGGRVCTYKHGKYIADVGAGVITGLGGNPLRVLDKQITMKLRRINQKCPLFYGSHQPIDMCKDEMLETVFNTLLEGTNILSNRMNFNQIGNRAVSLGEALDVVVELQERDVKQRYLKHLNDIVMLEEKLSENLDKLKTLQECINGLYEKHKEYVGSKTQRSVKQEYAFRVNKVQLNQAIAQHEKVKDNVARIEQKIRELESKTVAREYLSPGDRRILDWHFANLEFATNTPLSTLSLQHWDQEEGFEFAGPQISIKNGFSCIPYALADGVEVNLNQVVRSVKIGPAGVEVTAVNIDKYNHMYDTKALAKRLATATPTKYHADAVLCTAPLGVLKNSIATRVGSATEPNPNQIEFEPPLPDYKVGAINRLGYGNLNKVVLIFDSVFWDKSTHLFGHVSPNTRTRGELFLYWSIYKQPVLISLIAGESANEQEKVEDEVIKQKCLNILCSIYPNISNLKSYYVTRWGADPWSLGSYSYVGIDSTGDDYDLLAEPVCHPTGSGGPDVPRLFFGGEHTIRQHPATVHGALLSGISEAAKIANQFLGVPYQK